MLSRKASPRTLPYPLVPEYRRHVLFLAPMENHHWLLSIEPSIKLEPPLLYSKPEKPPVPPASIVIASYPSTLDSLQSLDWTFASRCLCPQ